VGRADRRGAAEQGRPAAGPTALQRGGAKGEVVGHWVFEETPGVFKDSAGVQQDLVRQSDAIAGGRNRRQGRGQGTRRGGRRETRPVGGPAGEGGRGAGGLLPRPS
jgi:hypothetical protein